MYDEITFNEGIECSCGKKIIYFQTKDLDNVLDNYRILKDGFIELEVYDLVEVSEKKRNEFGFPFARRKHLFWHKLELTDTIYGSSNCKCGKEYNILLTYVKGKLVNKEIKKG